jgi:hypothetical protein
MRDLFEEGGFLKVNDSALPHPLWKLEHYKILKAKLSLNFIFSYLLIELN